MIFGHHPEPSFDFCIEIDDMEGYAYDLSVGLNFVPGHRSQWPFWSRLSRLLRFVNSGQAAALDEDAQRAIPAVHELEGKALGRIPFALAIPVSTLPTREA